MTGGLVGALVDAGIPENRAREFESAIRRGEVAISVTSTAENAVQVRGIMEKHEAAAVSTETVNG